MFVVNGDDMLYDDYYDRFCLETAIKLVAFVILWQILENFLPFIDKLQAINRPIIVHDRVNNEQLVIKIYCFFA